MNSCVKSVRKITGWKREKKRSIGFLISFFSALTKRYSASKKRVRS